MIHEAETRNKMRQIVGRGIRLPQGAPAERQRILLESCNRAGIEPVYSDNEGNPLL